VAAISPEYKAYLIDLFSPFGPIAVRPMFSVQGLYANDVMFGLVADEVIYMKTNDRSRKSYEDKGSKPFSFRMKSRGSELIVSSYFSLPERLYDEPEELAQWARRAYEAATASPHNEKKRRKRLKEGGARQPARRRNRS
jgi:DNA transformation protein and related proteins